MPSIRLTARDPNPDPQARLPDELLVETIPDPILDIATRRLNAKVVDEEIVDVSGNVVRRWVGTPEELAACAAVNPYTARMFALADRVLMRAGTASRESRWGWIRKTDRRVILPEDAPPEDIGR